MKKQTLTIAAVVAVLALAAAPFVVAAERHARAGNEFGPMMMFGRLDRIKSALDLSDAQVDQLKTIGQQLREQNAPYREQIHSGLGSVAQLLVANPNDLGAAQAQLDKQEQAEHAMKSNALAAASKALNVLTPEQRTKVATFLANRAARRSGRG
jgi:Spy/CpxP family protein refolding chaperone